MIWVIRLNNKRNEKRKKGKKGIHPVLMLADYGARQNLPIRSSVVAAAADHVVPITRGYFDVCIRHLESFNVF